MKMTNIFTMIIEFDIPDEVVAEFFKRHNDHFDGDSEYKFTDAEMAAILSRDAVKVLEQFASEYAIVVGDKAYALVWLYYRSTEDYKKAGITPEMVSQKLESGLLSVFDFTDAATTAFENKLSSFIGE